MRWLLLLSVAGCSYPEFQFTPPDATGAEAANADDSSFADSFVEDARVEETVSPDSTVDDTPDTFAPDTFAPDTFAPDTFAPDTFAPDTFKPDTAVVDTFTPDVPISTGCVGSTATFCVDWDKVTTPAADFNYSGVGGMGSLTLDMGGGRSSPNALLARTAPDPLNEVVVANMSKLFSVAAFDTLVRVDAWIKLETATYPTTDGGAFLLKIQRGTGDGDGMTFSINSSGFYVDTIGTIYDYFPIASPKPKAGVWTHIRLHTKLHTTAGSATVWIDDMSTAAFSKSGLSTLRSDTLDRQLIVGLYSQKASGAFGVRYDDVTLSY